jgi:catechol 2,3-dioxygenase
MISPTPTTSSISSATTLGAVHLTVASLARSRRYWQDTVGLDVLAERDDRLVVGVGSTPLVVLVEHPDARPVPGATGLFHLALLLPSRRDLGRWFAHALRSRVALAGASDHLVSEAIYLRDPDHHGIEIYADRPRAQWEGNVSQLLDTLPLDAEGLLGEVDDAAGDAFDRLPAATVIGHVHLCVASVPDAIAFWHGIVGFDLMAQMGSQAAFLAAGGYHHHLGANTWQSAGGAPPPANAAALRHFTITLPDAAERSRVLDRLANSGYEPQPHRDGPIIRDPAGNGVVFDISRPPEAQPTPS